MTSNLSFDKCFWDEKINQREGFIILDNKMKISEDICKNYADFLEQRAKIEMHYSKELKKVLKNFNVNSEFGQLKASFEVMKLETEKICQHHTECSENFRKSSERLKNFYFDYKRKRKTERERVQNQHYRAINDYDKVNKFKEEYHSKSAALDAPELNERSESMNVKEMQKFHTKRDKAKRDASQSETNYRESLRDLQNSLTIWSKEFMELCQKAELSEKDRIIYIRNEMWACANSDSLKSVEIDKGCEEIRKSLENCNEEKDIREFAEQCKTKHNSPPELPEFEAPPKKSTNPNDDFVPPSTRLPNYSESQQEALVQQRNKEYHWVAED